MNITAESINLDKGTAIKVLTTTDTVIGYYISINSKGVNLKDAYSGKVITRALSKVLDLTPITDEDMANVVDPDGDELGVYADPDPDEDELTEDEAEDGIADVDISDTDGDNLTTADVAAIFDMPTRELRKVTRAMGLGVGRGRTYSFNDADVKAIDKELKTRTAADATA
jgi:hypothetical protein